MTEVSADADQLLADSRSAARIQAAQTRAASGPKAKPLSPPAAVAPDALFGRRGRILRRHAYDLGSAAPALLPDAPGEEVQRLGVDDAISFTLDRVLRVFPSRKPTSTGVRRVLRWLDRFDGDTWEQRWLASGADLAPRTWRSSVTPRTPEPSVAQGVNALLVARVLRPSYGWQLASRAGAHLPQRLLTVNEAEQLEGCARCLPIGRRCCGTSTTPRPACRGC